MNKHLFETKKKSIAHYDEEIEKLEQALKLTKETKKELVDSMVEFFPFEKGDIIFNTDGRLRQIFELSHVYERSDGLVFSLKVKYPSRYGNFESNIECETIPLDSINDWSKLN